MYTADDARNQNDLYKNELDERIENAVKEAQKFGNTCASIRVYIDDPFVSNIKQELEKRGFSVTFVPDIILKGDVDFYW